MRILHIDIETFSDEDLKKTTVYRYASSPLFDLLLCGYALDDEEITVIDLTAGEKLPDDFVKALEDPSIIKQAYNAQFERVCLGRHLGHTLDPEQWRCTMAHAASLGLPRSLKDVGEVLGLPEDEKKMKEGKALIQYFCKPYKGVRRKPSDSPERWKTFVDYNKRDVAAERAIQKRLDAYPMPDNEWKLYAMDQRINDRGVLIDTELMDAAIKMDAEYKQKLMAESKAITGLDNTNSLAQLKGWLDTEGPLDKAAVAEMLKQDGLSDAQRRVLAIRQELGKSSVSKYEAMRRGICPDGRVKGLFAFYGAATGRWAGRQLQCQNLPANNIEPLGLARDLVKRNDAEGIEDLFGAIPNVLSELIRTAIAAPKGRTFCVADFSAIEARVIAWYAGEKWRQEVFAEGGDIYCASASQMFRVPVEKNGINGHLRKKGKIAELGLGFGGSVGALKNMGAVRMGIAEEELQPIVDAWRDANKNIVELWWLIDEAARDTILNMPYGVWKRGLPHGIEMMRTKKMLHIKLPSGRCIRYWKPGVEVGDHGRENITYYTTNLGKWSKVNTYGPKLVENIVQATARDCLAEAMQKVEKQHPGIVMHVHDEMVIETDKPKECMECMLEAMSQSPVWAQGLLLRGAGYTTPYYRKD